MDKSLSYDELHALLKKRAKEAGTQKALADQMGISPSYLHDLIFQKRAIAPQIARKLGYKVVIRFDPIKEA